MKNVCVALLMMVTPGLAFAQCIGDHSEQVVMSCPQGQTFDASTEKCVAPTTG